MQYLQNTTSSLYQLTSQIDALATGIDPDFDAAYEELNREFAELRLQLGNE